MIWRKRKKKNQGKQPELTREYVNETLNINLTEDQYNQIVLSEICNRRSASCHILKILKILKLI